MGDKEPDPHEGPIENRLSHTNWKFRRAACEDMNKLFLSATSNQPFDQYSPYFKKIIEDKNISAKEAGLECLLTWLDRAENPQRSINLISSLATETFGARAKAKELGLKSILTFIEVLSDARFVPAAGEAFVNGLYEVATTSKNAKIAALAINTVKVGLTQFGPKVIPLKFILKDIVKFFEVSDAGIREEAMALAVEAYRWAGEPIKPTFANLRPAQLKDLNEKCAALPPTAQNPPKPEKQLRYQLSIEPEVEVAASGGGAAGGADSDDNPAADAGYDPWEAADPVDILSKIDAKFQTDLEAKKWADRRDAYKMLITLTDPPTVRIATGNYGSIRAAIIKGISKDVNMVVSETAANAATALSKALRGGFNEDAKAIVPSLLEKYKATKTSALAAFDEALDQFVQPDKKWSIGIQDILDSLIGALQNKLSQVKEKTCQYLLRLVAKTNRNALAAALKAPTEAGTLIAKLVELVDNESDEKVREAGYKLLAEITGKVGEKFISPYTQKLDSIKINKLKGMYPENMFQGVIGPVVTAKPAAAPAQQAKGKPQQNATKPPASTASTRTAPTANKPPTTTAATTTNKPPVTRGATSQNKPATPKPATPNVITEEPKQQVNTISASDNVVEEDFSSDVAAEISKHDILSRLKSTDWKHRKEALEKLESILRKSIDHNLSTMHSEAAKPAANYGWMDKVVLSLRDRIKDTQTNLVPIALNTLGTVAECVPPKSAVIIKQVREIIPGVILLLKASKPTRDAAVTVLDRWAVAAGLEPFIPILPEHFTNPVTAVRKELLEWFALNAFKEDVLSGGNNVSLSKKMEILVRPSLACLDDRSPEVPKLAEHVIAEIVSHVGWAPYIAELKRITNPSTKSKVEPVLKRVKQNLTDSGNSYNEIVQSISGNSGTQTNTTTNNVAAAATTNSVSSPSKPTTTTANRGRVGTTVTSSTNASEATRARAGTTTTTPGRTNSATSTATKGQASTVAPSTPHNKPSPLELNIANAASPTLNYTSINSSKPNSVPNPSTTTMPEPEIVVSRADTSVSRTVASSHDSKLEQRYAALATGDTDTIVKLVRVMCSDMTKSDLPFIGISEYLTIQLSKHLAKYLALLQPHQNQRVSQLGPEGRALTYIFTALHFILQRPALAMVVAFDILKSLLKLVLEADSFVDSAADQQQQTVEPGTKDENVTVAQLIAKFTTRIVLDVIKNTDYNASWTSLMGLLYNAFDGNLGDGVGDKVKYVKLIVGSLQRMMEFLRKGGAGSNIENVNIDQILYDIHHFLDKHTIVLSMNVKPSEGSFITEALCSKVKGVLEAAMSNLVTMKGRNISSHFKLLPVDKYPPVYVVTYISKLINGKYGGADKPNARADETSAAALEFKDDVERKEEMIAILQKIGSEESEQEEMKELYWFRKKNPVEVDKYLEGRSSRFQGYIKEALINLSKTLEPNSNPSFGANADGESDSQSSPNINSNTNTERVDSTEAKTTALTSSAGSGTTSSTSSAGGWEERMKAMRERYPSAYQDSASSTAANSNTTGSSSAANGAGISGIYAMRGTSSSTTASLELLKERARNMGLGLGGTTGGATGTGSAGSEVDGSAASSSSAGGSKYGTSMSASLPVASTTAGSGTSSGASTGGGAGVSTQLDDLRQRFRNLQRKREEEEQPK